MAPPRGRKQSPSPQLPRHLCFPGPGQGTSPACYMLQTHSVGKAAGGGASCGQLQWMLRSSKKVAVLGEAKIEQRMRQKTQQGSPREGTGRALGLCPGHRTRRDGPMATPPFHPRTKGVLCPHNTHLGFFSTRHRRTWISAHVVTKTDYTQTSEQI